MGYMGPKKTPMKELAMALPIKDGMNHIVISNLFGERSVHIEKCMFSLNIPDCQKCIDE